MIDLESNPNKFFIIQLCFLLSRIIMFYLLFPTFYSLPPPSIVYFQRHTLTLCHSIVSRRASNTTTNNIINNIMAANNEVSKIPRLVCVKKESIDPLTFKEWVNRPSNVYISRNVHKYLGYQSYAPPNYQEWSLGRVEFRYRNGEIDEQEYHAIYEQFYKTHMWSDIDSLFGKTLGCWCPTGSTSCHGNVLIKLAKQKILEARMTSRE